MTTPRARAPLAIMAAVVIVAGLAVHFLLPGGDFLGDALYAALVYLIVSLLFPQLPVVVDAMIAWLVCAVIELFQLTGIPIVMAERFPPARLLFGTTFAAIDLLAYAVGIALFAAGGMLARIMRRRPTTQR